MTSFSSQASPFTDFSSASRRASQADGLTINPRLLSRLESFTQASSENQLGFPPQQSERTAEPGFYTHSDLAAQHSSALQPSLSTHQVPATQLNSTPQFTQTGTSAHSGTSAQPGSSRSDPSRAGRSQSETNPVGPAQLDPALGDPTTRADLQEAGDVIERFRGNFPGGLR
jgi:hypothetical protein